MVLGLLIRSAITDLPAGEYVVDQQPNEVAP